MKKKCTIVKEHTIKFELTEEEITELVRSSLIKSEEITSDYKLIDSDYRVSNNYFMDLTITFKKIEQDD